jgi:hypothetical protein
MRCAIWNGCRSARDDTVAVEMGYWRRMGRGRGMVRRRREGMGLMETKVSAGLAGGMSNRGHGGRSERGREPREGGMGVETGRKAKR